MGCGASSADILQGCGQGPARLADEDEVGTELSSIADAATEAALDCRGTASSSATRRRCSSP